MAHLPLLEPQPRVVSDQNQSEKLGTTANRVRQHREALQSLHPDTSLHQVQPLQTTAEALKT